MKYIKSFGGDLCRVFGCDSGSFWKEAITNMKGNNFKQPYPSFYIRTHLVLLLDFAKTNSGKTCRGVFDLSFLPFPNVWPLDVQPYTPYSMIMKFVHFEGGVIFRI